jgi:hypothetical protein
MRDARSIAVVVALCATTIFAAAQGQPAPAPAPAGEGRGGGQGRRGAGRRAYSYVGRCDPPDFASAGGHFDPGPAGNTDPDMNHPYHSGDLLNIVANATGAVVTTSYTTRINLGGPVSPLDADGAAIIIHQNPDTNQTGTKGQGGGGGTAIACGVIVK